MTTAAEVPRLTALSHGAGCACKLPLATLERLMASVGPGLGGAADPNLLVGAADGDDAAVFRLDDQRALVVTTDFFTPIVDDARDWGRVAAANALSDVYAMGGRPLLALNLTAWPAADLPVELLAEVLRGGAEVAAEAGCPVVGGHSIDDPEPKYGLAVVGLADPARLLTIARARPGDRLVLTKPLGAGSGSPRLTAVATTPVPSGLVSTSRSPGRALAMVSSRAGSAIPTTARPYLGSGSSIEWPPTTGQPACPATSAPPRRTSASSSTGRSAAGQAVRLSAISGRPPMA